MLNVESLQCSWICVLVVVYSFDARVDDVGIVDNPFQFSGPPNLAAPIPLKSWKYPAISPADEGVLLGA